MVRSIAVTSLQASGNMMIRSVLSLSSALAVLVSAGPPALADDWPQWLGPNRDTVWGETGILESFPKDGPPLRWTRPLGGGYSGPAVAGGRVFVMDRQAEKIDLAKARILHDGPPPKNANFLRKLLPGSERIVCLDEKTGKLIWEHKWVRAYTTVAIYAIGPRATPTVDGDRVYALGAEGDLKCLAVSDGKILWERDFQKDYGLKIPEWGTAAHPLVDGDRLICVVGGKGTTCVAFDKRTGKELWRALSSSQPGYCPPVIHTIAGRRQLLIWHGDALESLDPRTGKVFWSVPVKPTFGMSVGQPVVEGRRVFVMSFNRVSACIEVSQDGSQAKLAWRGNARRGVGGVFNTAVIQDGHVYACGQNGRFVCARLDDGHQIWNTFAPATGRRPASWANVFAIRQGNRYFLANDLGELIIARLSPAGYEEVSRAKVITPTHKVGNRLLVWSHPAFANRNIYLRNDREIRCYSLAKPGR